MKHVFVIPIVAGPLRATTTKFEYNESLAIENRIEHVQKSALLGAARITFLSAQKRILL